jgi:hypothetical protein
VLPRKQEDPGELNALVRLLRRHGIEVRRLRAAAVAGEHHLSAGDFVVPLAQPYRPFVKEMLEAQEYPERHYTPGGELIKPYDITSWSLPLHMGVRAIQIDSRSIELEGLLEPVGDEDLAPGFEAPGAGALALLPAERNQSYRVAFAALGKGVPVRRTTAPVTAADGTVTLAAGSFVIEAGRLDGIEGVGDADPEIVDAVPATDLEDVAMPRIALVETFFHDMDAGWTRYLFDSYRIPYTVLHPGELESADLAGKFDVVVFPDASKDVLTKGKYKRGDRYVVNDYPPEFREPISKGGLAKLAAFIQGGGTVVSWGGSTALFTDGLAPANGDEGEGNTVELPVRDIADERKDVMVPGAFLAVDYLQGHPVTWGMPARGGAFSRGRPIFATSIPRLDTDRRVAAVYPERELLLSGYLEGEKQLQNTPAVVWVRAGKGQLVLFAIRPQFRGSTPATFKLVFNALLLPKVE